MDSFQNSPDREPSHSDLIQEYELTIQHLQTQNYSLKSRLAVAEDSLRRRQDDFEDPRDRRVELKYKTEIQELSSAIRTYENEQTKLQEERAFWETKAKALEQKYAQCLEDVEELDAFNATTQLSAQTKADMLSKAEADLSNSRLRCELLAAEVARLTERSQGFEALQTQHATLKTQFADMESTLAKKDELLKAAGKRCNQIQKRTETLEKENSTLMKAVANLEQDKRRLNEKWQTVTQRTKGDEKSKSRIKELEDLCAQYRLTAEQGSSVVSEWERRARDLEASLSCANETVRKLKVQVKMLTSEKDNLAELNEQLSVKLHRSEESEDGGKVQRKLNQAISDVASLQLLLRAKEEEISKLGGKKLAVTCRGDSLSGLLKSVGREEDLRRELERKEEDLRQMRTQCAQLTGQLQQAEVWDARFAQAYELEPSQTSSPQKVSNALSSLLQSKRIRSTSHGIAPLEDNKDLSRSKTPTPSQANTTRRCSNPPSPALNHTDNKSQNDETPKYAVQEVVIGLNSSHGKFRLSRRTTSEKQPWKT